MKNLIAALIVTILLTILAACGGGGPIDWDNWTNDPYYLEQAAELEQYPGGCQVIMLGDSRVKGGYWPGWCNYGINGDTSEGVLKRIDVIKSKNPSVVVFQAGRNGIDMVGNSSDEEYQYYLAALNSLDCRVIVTSTIPNGEGYETNSTIHELNALLESSGFEYLDINASLAPDGFLIYTFDEVHPDQEGNDIWLEMLNNIL